MFWHWGYQSLTLLCVRVVKVALERRRAKLFVLIVDGFNKKSVKNMNDVSLLPPLNIKPHTYPNFEYITILCHHTAGGGSAFCHPIAKGQARIHNDQHLRSFAFPQIFYKYSKEERDFGAIL